MPEEILATITQTRDDTLLEVALVHDADAEPRVELRSLLWGTGLGWYRGQTLTMDRASAQALLQSLSQARHRIGGAAGHEFGRKVIPFPRPAAPPTSAEPQAVQR